MTVTAAIAVIDSGLLLISLLPSELVPVEDRGFGFGIVIAPEGATLNTQILYVKRN